MDVLVVDDDARLLRLLALTLRLDGLEVVGVANGDDALAIMDGQQPRLLVVDLNMPEMSGEELWEKALAAGYEGPLLVVSADSRGQFRSAALGAVFISKPFDPQRIVETVRHLLQGDQLKLSDQIGPSVNERQ